MLNSTTEGVGITSRWLQYKDSIIAQAYFASAVSAMPINDKNFIRVGSRSHFFMDQGE
jgi:hypothetical protein